MRPEDNNYNNNNDLYTDKDFDRDFYGSEDRAEALGIYDEYEGMSSGRSRRKKKKEKAKNQKNYNKKSNKNSKKNGGMVPGGKPKKSKKKTALIIVISMLVLVATCFALGYGYLQSKLGEVNRYDVSDEDWGIDPDVAEDLKDYKNILLIGIDAREGENPEETRSDALILVTINKKTNEVTLTSIMRDSYLDIEEDGENVLDKITHAHAYAGPVNTVRALNRNLDLNIDDFIRVDWEAVASVTNAMDGLVLNVSEDEMNEVNRCMSGTNPNLSEENRNYTMLSHMGNQTLKGAQVVSYCRIRKTDGDEQRTERMRKVIVAAFDKAKKLKLSQLNDVVDIAMKEVTTSMSNSTMLDILTGLTNYKIGDSQSWPFDWEGSMINEVSYDVPITLKANVIELHEKLFGQKDYTPTDGVLEINERIKAASGIYGDETTDYNYTQDTYNNYDTQDTYTEDNGYGY